MRAKLSVETIAMAALILALSSVAVNQVLAANEAGADQGKGHKKTCSAGNSDNEKDGPCPGNSGGHGSSETTNAGQSDQIKKEKPRQSFKD